VVELLANSDPEKAGLEEMFLLFSYDTSGTDKPELMRTWSEHITGRFPDSPWARAAQTLLAENDKNHKARQHETELLARYDLNHDGILDAQEKAAMEKDPAYQHAEQNRNAEMLGDQLPEIMKRYDRNGDGKLDREELNYLHTQVLMFSSADPAMLAGKKILLAPLLTKNFPSVDEILKKYDQNGTGTVNMEGLKALAKDIQKNDGAKERFPLLRKPLKFPA
jgi:Ca2+-binding EF-hand superfamily protein